MPSILGGRVHAADDDRGPAHVAIVTGANHGIGAAVARALADAGAQVLLTFFRRAGEEHTDADDVVAAIERAGGRGAALEANLADASAAERILDVAEERFGPVDILINNASDWVADTFRPTGPDRVHRPTTHLTPASFDRVFAVDARASALLIAAFAERHIARGASWGRIVGLTSGGPLGFPDEVSYGAAKAALENLTMSAAMELAPFGVTANAVHPPVTDTGWVTPEVEAFVRASDELFHIAQPEDVAAVVGYLCTEGADLITANVIHLR